MIKQIIKPKEKDLGGFVARRFLPHLSQKMVGPWIFFDHLGPVTFAPSEGIDVRPHPHINLATVTYLFSGEILHRDSIGVKQKITPGAINLMVAGSGIVHSERVSDEVRKNGQEMEALQLWMALPEEFEEIDPEFFHYKASDIEQLDVNGVKVRLMIGSFANKVSPVKQFARTLYLEIDIKDGQEIMMPEEEELAIYVVRGQVNIGSNVVEQNNLAILRTDKIMVSAKQDAKFVVIGGQKLPKRYIEWNFVSSKKERIEKAKKDWQNGNFKKVVGDEEEFIPLPF